MSKLGWMGILGVAATALIAILISYAPALAQTNSERVFELRTYTCHEGRLDALHQRFRDHTNALFVKHGMKLIAYWTPTDGDAAANTLIYVIAHDSRDAAKASWQAFVSDPAWQEAKANSEADGPIVAKVDSVFMKATDYSPIQ